MEKEAFSLTSLSSSLQEGIRQLRPMWLQEHSQGPGVLTFGEGAAGEEPRPPAPLLLGVWLQDSESVCLGREGSGVSVLGLTERVEQGGLKPEAIRCPSLLFIRLRNKADHRQLLIIEPFPV